MTPQEVRDEILSYPIGECLEVLVAFGRAVDELREQHGGTDNIPEGPLKDFLDRVFNLAEEAGV